MKNLAFTALPALLLALAPTVAHADVTPGHTIFQTSEINIDRPSGAAEGNLNVSIYPDGAIIGYFRAVDSGRLIDVHGAVNGEKIYLDIGGEKPINGTLRDGKITAYRTFGSDLYKFTATESAIGQS